MSRVEGVFDAQRDAGFGRADEASDDGRDALIKEARADGDIPEWERMRRLDEAGNIFSVAFSLCSLLRLRSVQVRVSLCLLGETLCRCIVTFVLPLVLGWLPAGPNFIFTSVIRNCKLGWFGHFINPG